MEVPLALAFTAGLVATINPCGFAMLPAYLSYFIGMDDGMDDEAAAPGPAGMGRGLVVGVVVSAGFLTVFGVAGVLLTLGVQQLVEVLPWAALVVGIGVSGLGIAMVGGYEVRAALPTRGTAPTGRALRGVYGFGVSYAVASLSCTLPVFLVVVAGTIPQLGFVAGVTTFLVYGLGMSSLLLLVTLALALGKRAIIGWLRRSSQHVNRVAGGILILAGVSIVVFWISTLAGDGTSPLAVVVWIERLSSLATNAVWRRTELLGAAAAVVVTVAALSAGWQSRRRARDAANEDVGSECP
jgi:cytochrome c-type biogenesis protein